MGLCYRCEHRARHYEDKGYHPRYECGDVKMSVSACYMYQPVMPVVLAPQEGDERPPGGPWFIAARMEFVKVPVENLALAMERTETGYIMHWRVQEWEKPQAALLGSRGLTQ